MIISSNIIITLSIIFIIALTIYYNKNIENFYSMRKFMESVQKRVNDINYKKSSPQPCTTEHRNPDMLIRQRKYSKVERAYWANSQKHNNQIIDMDIEYPEKELLDFSSDSKGEKDYFEKHGKKHEYWRDRHPTKIYI